MELINVFSGLFATYQTSFVPETDQLNYTKRGMIASIDVAMGGRVAEEIYYGNAEITTGKESERENVQLLEIAKGELIKLTPCKP